VSQGLEMSPVGSSLHLEILLRVGTRRVVDGEVVIWKYSKGILGRQEDWADILECCEGLTTREEWHGYFGHAHSEVYGVCFEMFEFFLSVGLFLP